MKNIKIIFYICTLIAALASSLSAQVTATLTQPKGCENNGMIELQIEGEGPFTIDWTTLEFGGSTPQPTEVAHEEWNNQTKITDLAPGQYCVTVKNAKCCEAKQCFWLEKEGGSVKVAYKKNVSTCSGKPTLAIDGEIYIEIPSKYQESDYDFKWTYKDYPNWVISTKKDLVGVQAETYVLTAYNKITGCEEIIEVKLCCCPSFDENGKLVILSDDELKNACDITANNMTVDAKATPPTGKGATNGSIVLTIKGAGSDPMYYRWRSNTGKEYFTKDIKNLPSGDYCYTVTNGCQTIKDCVPIYVCEEKPMIITPKIAKPCDYGEFKDKGAIELTIGGGQNATPYKFIWKNGATTQSLSKLVAGEYCVTVTDKAGCTANQCVKVENQKYEYKRVGCTDYHYCDGVEVAKKDWGSFQAYDPFDCRYLNTYCNDKPTTPISSKFIGTKYVTNGASCILDEVCGNGKTYKTHFGTPYEGLTDDCFYVKGCRFPSINKYYEYSKVNKLQKATIVALPNPDSPNGFCKYEEYCNNVLIFEYQGDYAGSPCQKGNFSADDINALLNNQNNGSSTNLYDGQPNLSEKVSIEKTTKRFEDAIKTYNGNQTSSSENILIESIVPNPFQNSFVVTVKSETEQTLRLAIADLLGKEYYNSKHLTYKGSNKIELPEFGEIPDGVYILKVINEKGEVISEKIIKQ